MNLILARLVPFKELIIGFVIGAALWACYEWAFDRGAASKEPIIERLTTTIAEREAADKEAQNEGTRNASKLQDLQRANIADSESRAAGLVADNDRLRTRLHALSTSPTPSGGAGHESTGAVASCPDPDTIRKFFSENGQAIAEMAKDADRILEGLRACVADYHAIETVQN